MGAGKSSDAFRDRPVRGSIKSFARRCRAARMTAFEIRMATEADLPAILAIFNDLVLHSDAVYTEEPVTLDERRQWLRTRQQDGFPVLVADRGGEVLGVASFGFFRGAWPGYRHTVEHSVHVRRDQYRQGLGRALLDALLVRARAMDVHMMIGVIDAANTGSLRLHEQLGFRQVGVLPQVGRKFGRWLDVVFMQRQVDDRGDEQTAGSSAVLTSGGRSSQLPEAAATEGEARPVGARSGPATGPAPGQEAQPAPVGMRVPSNPVEHRSVQTRYGPVHLKVWPSAQGEAARRPTVVLFHGLFGDSDVWAATALNLNRAGLNVLAFDLPGHGASYAKAATMADVVGCIREALLAGGWPSLVLVGHSFGAVVATRLAADPVLGVKGLALLSPAGLGREVNNTFLEEVMAATDDRELAEALSYLTVKQQRASSTYLRLMLKRIEAARPQLRALIDEAVGPDDGLQHNSIREDLPRLACPIVIIQGREDGVMPWRHVLNAPSEAALHLLADVGHMPHWEANGLTNRVLLQLVNSVEHG